MKTVTEYLVTSCAVLSAVASLCRAQENGGAENAIVQNISVSILSETDVLVSWDPSLFSTNSTNDITGYRVYYSRVAVNTRTPQLLAEGDVEQFANISGRLTSSKVISGLVKDATYQFRVVTVVDGQQEPDREEISLSDYHILIARVTVNDIEKCGPGKLYIKTPQVIGGICAAIFCTTLLYSLILLMVYCCYKLSRRSVERLKKEVMKCDIASDYQTQKDLELEETSEQRESGSNTRNGSMVTNPVFETSISRYIDVSLTRDSLSPTALPAEDISKTT